MFSGSTAGGLAPQKTPTSALNTWYTVPTDTTAYWYVPYGATSVRIVMIGAGCTVTGANNSSGGGGGGCCEIILTVGASNGINGNEELKFTTYSYSSQFGDVTSRVWRSERDATNALGFVNAGKLPAGGTAGTQVTTGNGLTINSYSGGSGGGVYIDPGQTYATSGGGGGGAGPSGAGGSGTSGTSGGGGSGGSGGSGNASLPGSSGGSGGNGTYLPWGIGTDGNPGSNYGGGSGGQGWSASGFGGSSFFRIYAS